MSTEENQALARREFEAIWTSANLDAVEEIYAPNYISPQPASTEDIHGLEAIKQFQS